MLDKLPLSGYTSQRRRHAVAKNTQEIRSKDTVHNVSSNRSSSTEYSGIA